MKINSLILLSTFLLVTPILNLSLSDSSHNKYTIPILCIYNKKIKKVNKACVLIFFLYIYKK